MKLWFWLDWYNDVKVIQHISGYFSNNIFYQNVPKVVQQTCTEMDTHNFLPCVHFMFLKTAIWCFQSKQAICEVLHLNKTAFIFIHSELWVDNIKRGFKGIWCDSVDWIQLTQDTIQCQILVNMHLRFLSQYQR
jgi:hypothetical protein